MVLCSSSCIRISGNQQCSEAATISVAKDFRRRALSWRGGPELEVKELVLLLKNFPNRSKKPLTVLHVPWPHKLAIQSVQIHLEQFWSTNKSFSSCWSQRGLQITLMRIGLNFRVHVLALANQVAYTCLLLEKFYGREHSHTQACANLLIRPGATFTHFEREIVIDFVWVGT